MHLLISHTNNIILLFLLTRLNWDIMVTGEPLQREHKLREDEFEVSQKNCGSFFWTHVSCGLFAPVCGSNGKIYKNICAFQEALCYNSSLSVEGDSESCIKGNEIHILKPIF